jgi:hypothetical protein
VGQRKASDGVQIALDRGYFRGQAARTDLHFQAADLLERSIVEANIIACGFCRVIDHLEDAASQLARYSDPGRAEMIERQLRAPL